MSIESINKALRRKVIINSKYDIYFTKTPCKSTYLGYYTTTGGLHQMVEWALEHKDFSKEISKVLKGRNLKETVANIHQFIYEHVQYKADDIEQNLKSPSCVWNTRLEGTDCKSQSLFASTILLCLNIPHSFRKVKQPSEPHRWSHVYVKISSGNQTLIIDPTKRVNTEVQYIQKEDMEVKLPYHGLHAALPSVPSQQSETVANFRSFLAELNKSGVSKTVTQKIEYEVRRSTDRGINPMIDLQATHIVVNNVMIPYGVNVQAQGMGFVAEGIQTLFGSGFFSSLFGGQTSADEVMRDSMGRIQRMISQVSSMNLGAEAYTNKLLYNIGWLRAMHVRNGAHASSTRMKKGNAGAARNLDQKINEIFSKLASQASFTKQQKSVTFPGSNPLLGVNTHSNPGSYYVIRITGGAGNVNQGGGNQNIVTGGGSQNSNSGGTPVIPTGNGNVPSQNNNPNPNNNPNQNKGMSTTTKVVLGSAAILGVGTAVYLATKDKSNTNK
ncbi:hypothetical protein [uncultured Tenacibaculum sp.]|uniref:hypothetical protein n=1 Tax=uncultured Tenacibaculum sp. TaxID=174713 RepID=UPI0026024448|nr:hypothetical protein [uncultured Tenacibaculum sp.]